MALLVALMCFENQLVARLLALVDFENLLMCAAGRPGPARGADGPRESAGGMAGLRESGRGDDGAPRFAMALLVVLMDFENLRVARRESPRPWKWRRWTSRICRKAPQVRPRQVRPSLTSAC